MPTDPTTTTASGAGTPHLMVGLVFFGGGFTPIGSLALSLLELVPLHIGGPVLIGVAMVTAAIVIAFHPASRVLLVRGLLAGLVAVLVYDGTRLPFIILGSWPDFIPRIGDWLFDTDHVHWLVGYLWRYLGNGAGMGLAFMVVAPVAARRLGSVRFGLLYGVAIWSGLVATLLVAPDGQEKMFALTAGTAVLSIVGHLVYGGVLGLIHHRLTQRSPRPEAGPGERHRATGRGRPSAGVPGR